MDRITFKMFPPNADPIHFTAGCENKFAAIPPVDAPIRGRRYWERQAAAGSLQASQQLGEMDELQERAAGQ